MNKELERQLDQMATDVQEIRHALTEENKKLKATVEQLEVRLARLFLPRRAYTIILQNGSREVVHAQVWEKTNYDCTFYNWQSDQRITVAHFSADEVVAIVDHDEAEKIA